jgi:hypothetical protein
MGKIAVWCVHAPALLFLHLLRHAITSAVTSNQSKVVTVQDSKELK